MFCMFIYMIDPWLLCVYLTVLPQLSILWSLCFLICIQVNSTYKVTNTPWSSKDLYYWSLPSPQKCMWSDGSLKAVSQKNTSGMFWYSLLVWRSLCSCVSHFTPPSPVLQWYFPYYRATYHYTMLQWLTWHTQYILPHREWKMQSNLISSSPHCSCLIRKKSSVEMAHFMMFREGGLSEINESVALWWAL